MNKRDAPKSRKPINRKDAKGDRMADLISAEIISKICNLKFFSFFFLKFPPRRAFIFFAFGRCR